MQDRLNEILQGIKNAGKFVGSGASKRGGMNFSQGPQKACQV